ncbi:hypothetical protein J8824_27200, partial [Klebsiella pneumoniae]
MLLAGAIFVLTIVLVIWQPKGLGLGWTAILGAGLVLRCSVLSVGDILVCLGFFSGSWWRLFCCFFF